MASAMKPRTIIITSQKRHALLSIPQSVTISLPMTDSDSDRIMDEQQPRKRRRLTNLSAEEKMLRRKLKNRVAAQTARDRKKAQMSDLEIKLAAMEAENKKLQQENLALRTQSGALAQENSELKKRLSGAVSSGTESESHGSAASAVPLPKEQILALSGWMTQFTAFVLTLSLMYCLGCYNSSTVKQTGSSQKRKQSQPMKRILPMQHSNMHLKWWGPQQQSWNPSMNL